MNSAFSVRWFHIGLFLCILASGFSGIVAELNLFNLAHLLVGGTNRVLAYTMGVMMFFMGVGSLSVRYTFFRIDRITTFFLVELLLSMLIASSVFVIYALGSIYPDISLFFILFYSAAIGFLIGFEIPLMLLILENQKATLVKSSSFILFADYLGSLLGFILFTHILLHQFGLPLSGLIVSSVNLFLAVGITLLFYPKKILQKINFLFLVISFFVLIFLFNTSSTIINWSEKNLFRDTIIESKQTPYQQVVLTKGFRNKYKKYDKIHQEKSQQLHWLEWDFGYLEVKQFKSISSQNDIRLFINGGLQFSTLDEFRYHELLVHPVMSLSSSPKTILIGGGGDGLAVREVLKYPDVERIFLVDIDSTITHFFSTNILFKKINKSSLTDPRVTIIHQDMVEFLRKTSITFDVVILDFPDPHYEEVAKLYSRQFYQYVKKCLAKDGLLVTQSTSPLFHRQAFLTIFKTLMSVFPEKVLPYQVSMLTFGQWGFHLLKKSKNSTEIQKELEKVSLRVETKYLNRMILKSMSAFGKGLLDGYSTIKIEDWLKPNLTQIYQNI